VFHTCPAEQRKRIRRHEDLFTKKIAKIAREVAMNVRDMKGNPGIWEKLLWTDMSSKEKELWTILGWQQDKWDRNEAQ
jgi:hypothetical protein